MSNFLFSINVTIPIFLVMVIGYFLRQIGMLNENFVTVANKFNFKVTLPFLLFRDLSTVNIQEVFDLKYVLFCAIATSVCFWSVYGLTKIFMKDRSMTGAFVQASFRSSAAVMGLAFISNLYGPSAMGPLMIIGAVPLYNIYSVLAVCMVSQTTSTEILWKKCVNYAKKQFTYLQKFDTICRATECRQREASELSQRCEAMVVVGDLKSSNTGRLAMICREHCNRVYLVDNAGELNPQDFCGVSDVGITAGASTPAWIIKEVNKTMSEITNVEAVQEENFAELLEQSIKTLNTGDKVIGTVTGIGNTEIQVDLGTKHAGYIPYDEVSTDPSVKPEDILKVGDEIEVFVVRVNDQEGTVQLSKKKLDGLKVWDEMADYVENKTTIDAVITEENKGGLVANVKGVRVFIPASQSGVAKGGDMAAMVGKHVQLKITEVNRIYY